MPSNEVNARRKCPQKSKGDKKDGAFNEAAAENEDEAVKLAFQIRQIEKWEREAVKEGEERSQGFKFRKVEEQV